VTESQPAGSGGNALARTYELVAKALSAVQGQLRVVIAAETGEVSGEGKAGKYSYKYKYADLAAIAEMVYPLLAENGLAFTAGPTVNARGQFVLRWMLLHTSGQYLDGEYPLPGDAKSPQQLGSAITYGRRYCLSAVIGVVTDDDDGAAAQYADRQQTVEPVDNDQVEAIARVQNAWTAQYGAWDPVAAGKAFADWSGGEDSRSAPHGRLRAFAAYLVTRPPEDAGSDPAETASPPPAERPETGKRMTPKQQGMLFAGWAELGVTDRQAQLQWVRDVTGVQIDSRSAITFDMAKQLLDEMTQRGVTVP